MTPEQIDDYCHRLAEAWKKMPEITLGNLVFDSSLFAFPNYDHWELSNEQLITAIERMVEK